MARDRFCPPAFSRTMRTLRIEAFMGDLNKRVYEIRTSLPMNRPLPTRPLPDYIRKNLRILSIGINPGRISSERGFVFAHPRNRFWPAFNASGLVPETFTPSIAAVERLFEHYGIGFTDVVSRPTPQANALAAADWRAGAPKLREKLVSKLGEETVNQMAPTLNTRYDD